jgi:hypothetical protein
VFSNKGYRWKLGAAVALIAVLGVYAGNRGDTINPSVGRCLAEPGRWDGAQIWIPAARIVAVHAADYEIESGIVRVRVAGPAPAPMESRISLIAIFHGAGPLLEQVHSRILPGDERFRLVMEVVSVLVAVAVFANFAGHFLFRPENLYIQRGAD